MTVLFSDAFTEASDTLLTSHTPNVGTGYSYYSGGSPTLRVAGGLGYCEAGHFSDGGRCSVSTSLGATNYDVSGDFTSDDGTVTFWGLRARNTTATALDGIEFVWGGTTAGYWDLNGIQTADSLPSYPVTLRLVVRAGVAYGYANGVLKCTYTGNENPTTGYYAGFLLGNFSGGARTIRIDNFSVATAPVSPAPRRRRSALTFR